MSNFKFQISNTTTIKCQISIYLLLWRVFDGELRSNRWVTVLSGLRSFSLILFPKRKFIGNLTLDIRNWKLDIPRHGGEGFTLVELLIVFAVMITLSVISMAAFSSYNTSQQLTSSVQDIKNMLQYAKTQTSSQAENCQSGQQFMGFKMIVTSTTAYEVDQVCLSGLSTLTTTVATKTLPTGVTFDTTASTSLSYLFNPIVGTVTGAGTLVIKQGSKTKNIIVSATGVIQ